MDPYATGCKNFWTPGLDDRRMTGRRPAASRQISPYGTRRARSAYRPPCCTAPGPSPGSPSGTAAAFRPPPRTRSHFRPRFIACRDPPRGVPKTGVCCDITPRLVLAVVALGSHCVPTATRSAARQERHRDAAYSGTFIRSSSASTRGSWRHRSRRGSTLIWDMNAERVSKLFSAANGACRSNTACAIRRASSCLPAMR